MELLICEYQLAGPPRLSTPVPCNCQLLQGSSAQASRQGDLLLCWALLPELQTVYYQQSRESVSARTPRGNFSSVEDNGKNPITLLWCVCVISDLTQCRREFFVSLHQLNNLKLLHRFAY